MAAILGGLIEQNLAREPARVRMLRPATVVIEAEDAEAVATLRFAVGSVSVSSMIARRADITVIAEPNELLAITAAPLRFGYPDPLKAGGRAVLAGIIARRVRIRGLFRHPLRLRRLTLLLSVA